jgi:hypothetical protein
MKYAFMTGGKKAKKGRRVRMSEKGFKLDCFQSAGNGARNACQNINYLKERYKCKTD